MDLFYNELTQDKQLNKLRIETKKTYDTKSNTTKNQGFRLIDGNRNSMGNCVLIVLDHVKAPGFFEHKFDKPLKRHLRQCGILNYIVTYCHPVISDKVSRKEVKAGIRHISMLVDIIEPKMILVLGEIATEAFLPRKAIIDDVHGQTIAQYQGVPVMCTFDLSYYYIRVGYEDKPYKRSIFESDWKNITKKYNELITIEGE